MASIDLRPIDRSGLDAATEMLVRGFPERSRDFWVSGLHRILTIHDVTADHPIGYMMTVGGQDAGIILTIPSPQLNGARASVAHLAAWYIDQPHRWLAARMMKKVVAANDSVFLDLTPNAASKVINEKLGFSLLNEGFFIYLLPLAAWRTGGTARLVAFDASAHELSEDERRIVEHHRKLGCIVGLLRKAGRLSPMIFSRMQRRGLPGARLILADSKADVTDNLGAISRFLLRQKVLFLRMDATRKDSSAGSFASRWTEPTYIKGARDRADTDFTYSEFVLLGT